MSLFDTDRNTCVCVCVCCIYYFFSHCFKSLYKKKKSSCWILMCLLNCRYSMKSSTVLSALISPLSSSWFSPHHCPWLRGQSLGHPHPSPSPSPQCLGTVTRPLQHCFQLQKKKVCVCVSIKLVQKMS